MAKHGKHNNRKAARYFAKHGFLPPPVSTTTTNPTVLNSDRQVHYFQPTENENNSPDTPSILQKATIPNDETIFIQIPNRPKPIKFKTPFERAYSREMAKQEHDADFLWLTGHRRGEKRSKPEDDEEEEEESQGAGQLIQLKIPQHRSIFERNPHLTQQEKPHPQSPRPTSPPHVSSQNPTQKSIITITKPVHTPQPLTNNVECTDKENNRISYQDYINKNSPSLASIINQIRQENQAHQDKTITVNITNPESIASSSEITDDPKIKDITTTLRLNETYGCLYENNDLSSISSICSESESENEINPKQFIRNEANDDDYLDLFGPSTDDEVEN